MATAMINFFLHVAVYGSSNGMMQATMFAMVSATVLAKALVTMFALVPATMLATMMLATMMLVKKELLLCSAGHIPT